MLLVYAWAGEGVSYLQLLLDVTNGKIADLGVLLSGCSRYDARPKSQSYQDGG
jgi:hypothetical protein